MAPEADFGFLRFYGLRFYFGQVHISICPLIDLYNILIYRYL